MPNICTSWVNIEGNEDNVAEFVKLVGKDFDFNKIIPTKNTSSEEAIEKWDCSSIAFEPTFDYEEGDWTASWSFWTKWNPPTFIYEKLCELFPDILIVWRYEERGMGLYGYLNSEEG